jgi:hypothetical protein
MKNYIQAFVASTQTNDPMFPPPTLTQEALFMSSQEAQDWLNGLALGPNESPNAIQMYYFLMNKWIMVNAYIQSRIVFAGLCQTDGTLVPDPYAYTQDMETAQNWGGDEPTWNWDANDKASVEARDSAEQTRNSKTTTTRAGKVTVSFITYLVLLSHTYEVYGFGAASAFLKELILLLGAGKITLLQAQKRLASYKLPSIIA